MKVSVDGAELHYSVLGRGSTCLVLTAVGTKPYIRMTSALSERLQLVYVDLRGGGQSTGNASDLTFEEFSSDLDAIRADVGAERVVVLGHSVLGILAIEYGRRRPASVSHVVACGTPPVWDLPKLAAAGRSFFEEDASEERKQVLRDNLARLPADAGPGQSMLAQTPMRFFDPRFDAAPVFADSEFRPELLAHIMGTLVRGWDVRSDARSSRVPLLIAHGRYDYTVPYRLWEGVASSLPHVTMRVFGRSGHQPFFEEPELFGATVDEWMASGV
jgi:proline iminopeptidase